MSSFDENTSLDGSLVSTEESKEGWVFVYPGQGSQFIGMGKDFYDASEQCKQLIDQAEQISQKKLTKFCFNGPISKLSNTDNLQVATTAVNLAITEYLLANTDIKPAVALGHSVGEYSALYAAGVLTYEDVINATSQRGTLMQREAKANKGGMLAVKDTTPEALATILDANFEKNDVVIANDNSPKQQVVSASKDNISKLSAVLSDAGIEYVKLPVSGAWHSPLMAGCVEEFAQTLAGIEFKKPQIPVVGNLQATFVDDPQSMKESLVSHVVEMVRWRESIEFLLAQGYRNFIEVGPKKVLSRLIDSINDGRYELNQKNVETIADVEAL